MGIVKVKFQEEDFRRIQEAIGGLIDPETRLYMHHRLAAYFDPYIPKETGTLAQTHVATPDYLAYLQPYAHYQWVGIVYGPNIPIKNEAGTVVGWFSIPNRPKRPMGYPLKHDHQNGPNQRATAHWDAVAMAEHGADYAEDVARYIAARFNGGG